MPSTSSQVIAPWLMLAAFVLDCPVADSQTGASSADIELSLPRLATPIHLSVPMPFAIRSKPLRSGRLLESGAEKPPHIAQISTAIGTDGKPLQEQFRLLAVLPAGQGTTTPRRFRIQLGPVSEDAPPSKAPSPFRFEDAVGQSLRLLEGDAPVFSYQYGTVVAQHVPLGDPRRKRACYVHPIWGLNGEVLTADFPADHFHHHGLFWTWPHVEIDGKHYDLWADRGGLRQKFLRWLHRETGPVAAVVAFENGWFIGDTQVMTERIWLTAFHRCGDHRVIDVSLTFIPKDQTISLRGAPGKSYGGLTLRFDPSSREATTITVPSGKTTADLPDTRLPWADLTSTFDRRGAKSGAMLMVHPAHPDFPPTWLTRHYGPLCVGWPGVTARSFPPNQPFQLNYRIWIHRGAVDLERLKAVYRAYRAACRASKSSSTRTPNPGPVGTVKVPSATSSGVVNRSSVRN